MRELRHVGLLLQQRGGFEVQRGGEHPPGRTISSSSSSSTGGGVQLGVAEGRGQAGSGGEISVELACAAVLIFDRAVDQQAAVWVTQKLCVHIFQVVLIDS